MSETQLTNTEIICSPSAKSKAEDNKEWYELVGTVRLGMSRNLGTWAALADELGLSAQTVTVDKGVRKGGD